MSFGVSLENVSLSINGNHILRNISVDFPEPLHVILGSNGSGKSMLAKVISLLHLPTRGTVRHFGSQVYPSTRDELLSYRRQVAYIPQKPTFIRGSVRENIEKPLLYRGYRKEEIEERIKDISQKFGIEHLLDKYPGRLSGGQRRRVSIAMMLSYEPRIVMFDESTTFLDTDSAEWLRTFLSELKGRGLQVFWITHDLLEARKIGGHCIYISKGQVQMSGTIEDLVSSLFS